MDLVALVQIFWNERILIVKITGAFLLVGLLVALLSPEEYSTSATLMPESQSTQGRAGNLLQQYGGMLGIRGGNIPGENIPTSLYPDIIESIPYQVELMNKSVYFSKFDTTVTPHVFFSEIYTPFNLIGFIKSYTIGLPGKIIGLFRSSENSNTEPIITEVNRDSVLQISGSQMGTVSKLKNRLTVTTESGVITVKSEFPDPQAAAEIAHNGIILLKEYVREYRTQKAKEDLEYVEEQLASAKKRFEKAQQMLAEFRDSNISLATAKARTREQELQSQYDLAFEIYNSMNQRREQARLQVQEQTPVFSILQPVSVPLSNSAPNRKLILIASGILGGIIALGWVLIQSWWKNEKNSFKEIKM
nr:Wzz/FepE/Etk N-terminal domain-containing protein [Fodinibius sediminis]